MASERRRSWFSNQFRLPSIAKDSEGTSRLLGDPLIRSLRWAAALAALLLSLTVLPVSAHAELVSASPGPDEVVVGSPTEVVTEFNQDLNPSRTTIRVLDEAGEVVAQGGEPGAGPREWRLELPNLEPGSYEVRYTSFSAEDGELHRGRYSFTVEASASPTPTSSVSPSPTARPTGPASLAPSTSPTSSLAPSPTSTATVSPSPVPSGVPGPGTGTGFDLSMALPIIVGLAVVAGLGLWLMRRRTT